MEHVKVGLFNLPGIRFEKGQIPEDIQQELSKWCRENHCGTQMNEWLWSFKNESQRDWFILRWVDILQEYEPKKDST